MSVCNTDHVQQFWFLSQVLWTSRPWRDPGIPWPPKVRSTTPLPAGCSSQLKSRQVEMGIRRHSKVIETMPQMLESPQHKKIEMPKYQYITNTIDDTQWYSIPNFNYSYKLYKSLVDLIFLRVPHGPQTLQNRGSPTDMRSALPSCGAQLLCLGQWHGRNCWRVPWRPGAPPGKMHTLVMLVLFVWGPCWKNTESYELLFGFPEFDDFWEPTAAGLWMLRLNFQTRNAASDVKNNDRSAKISNLLADDESQSQHTSSKFM